MSCDWKLKRASFGNFTSWRFLDLPTLCRIQLSQDPLVLQISPEAEGFVIWLVRDDGDLEEVKQTVIVATFKV